MITWRTKSGRARLNDIESRPFRDFLDTLLHVSMGPVWQCGCGNMDVVKYRKTIYCPSCGRVKINASEDYEKALKKIKHCNSILKVWKQ